MPLSAIVEPLTELARPFATYAAGAAVAIGVFVPAVTVDKLWVAAAVATGISIARTFDKRNGDNNVRTQ